MCQGHQIDETKGQFIAHLLKYIDIFNLQDLAKNTIKNRNKEEHGNKVSWLKIKYLKVEKELFEALFYRYYNTSDYNKTNVAVRGHRQANIELKPAYSGLLPVSDAKKADLLKLCDAGLIPEKVIPFCKKLPTNNLLEVERF